MARRIALTAGWQRQGGPPAARGALGCRAVLRTGLSAVLLGAAFERLCSLPSSRVHPLRLVPQAEQRGLKNVTMYVEDYADFVQPTKSQVGKGVMYDAAMAIETIEHCRNIRALLDAVGNRLRPGATLFVQSLCHQSASYLVDSGDWMGRNFFSGGSILSLNSYYHLTPPSLHLEGVEPILGDGYSRTLAAWLDNLEAKRGGMVAKYGSQFYEGFRAFYYVCVEAFAANKQT